MPGEKLNHWRSAKRLLVGDKILFHRGLMNIFLESFQNIKQVEAATQLAVEVAAL